MEQDDFCKTVGNSGILTAEEALDVLLHMKELTPRNKLAFSDKQRSGTWTEHFLTNTKYHIQNGSLPATSSSFSQSVDFNIPKGNIIVSCIFFINCAEARIDYVVLNRNRGNVRKLENRLHQGYQLYEAVFYPPVTVTPGSHTIIFSNNWGTEFGATKVSGQNTLQFRDIIIDVSKAGGPWYFIVGFKLRKY